MAGRFRAHGEKIEEFGENYYVSDGSVGGGNSITFMLYGSYNSDQREFINGQKPIAKYMAFAKKHGLKFIITKPHEPNMLWSYENPLYPREEKFIFDIIHDHIANTGMNPRDVRFVSGNMYVHESYQGWCNWKQIPFCDQIHVMHRAFWVRYTDESKQSFPYDYDAKVTKYFSVLNRNFRTQKGDILVEMVKQGLLEPEYADRYYKSFSFYDQNEHSLMMIQNPGIEKYFCNLENEDPADFDVYKSAKEVIESQALSHALSTSAFDFSIDYSAIEDKDPICLAAYQKTFPWHVENIFSEKTFRNMMYRRPFIRFGEAYSLRALRNEYGFKTFDGILFDESYDTITDYKKRITAVVALVKDIMDNYTIEQLVEKIQSPEVQEVMDYNHKRFTDIMHYLYNATGIWDWDERYFVNNKITRYIQADQ